MSGISCNSPAKNTQICKGKKRRISPVNKTNEKSHESHEGTQTEQNQEPELPHLPNHMVFEIVSRLPVKTLKQSLPIYVLSNPEFVSSHLSKSQNPGLLLHPCYAKNQSRQLRFYNLHDGFDQDCRESKLIFSPNRDIPRLAFFLESSVNGLLCLSVPEDRHTLHVCNPVLGEFLTLPNWIDVCQSCTGFIAIGFASKANQYKVLRIMAIKVHGSADDLFAEVYTLGHDNYWRSIGSAPDGPFTSSPVNSVKPFNSYVNGATHWLCNKPNSDEHIYSFDFESEKFEIIPGPVELDQSQGWADHTISLSILRGCLSLCEFDASSIQIYLMKTYGVKKSWTNKEIRIDFPIYRAGVRYYEILTILKTGEIVVMLDDNAFLLCCPKSKSAKRLSIYKGGSSFSAIAYVPTFVSLKNVAKGAKVKKFPRK